VDIQENGRHTEAHQTERRWIRCGIPYLHFSFTYQLNCLLLHRYYLLVAYSNQKESTCAESAEIENKHSVIAGIEIPQGDSNVERVPEGHPLNK